MSLTEIRTATDHNNFIHTHPKCVLFFGAKTCHHCQDMMPVIKDLIKKYPNVSFAHIELTEVNDEVANVDGFPVFVAYKSSTPINVIEGAYPEKVEAAVSSL